MAKIAYRIETAAQVSVLKLDMAQNGAAMKMTEVVMSSMVIKPGLTIVAAETLTAAVETVTEARVLEDEQSASPESI